MTTEGSDISKAETRETTSMDDFVSFIDSEFKPNYVRSRIKYYWPDLAVTVVMLVVVVIVLEVLALVAPLLATGQAGVAAFLTFFALVLSLLQLIGTWMDTPSSVNEAYLEDVIERNCRAVSTNHRVDDNLLLYALVLMKSARPGVKLAEVKQNAPDLFTSSALVSRLYGRKT